MEAITDPFHVSFVFKSKTHYGFWNICNGCSPFFHRKEKRGLECPDFNGRHENNCICIRNLNIWPDFMCVCFYKNSKCFWHQQGNSASFLVRPVARWLWLCKCAEEHSDPGFDRVETERYAGEKLCWCEWESLWVAQPVTALSITGAECKACQEVFTLMMKSKKSLKLGKTVLGLLG